MAAQPQEDALDLRRPFTRAEAMRAGVSAGRLRGPGCRRLLHGVYVAADVEWSPVLRVEAALRRHPPGAFASHVSAARVLGAPLPAGHDEEHVSVSRVGDRRRTRGVRPHVASPATPVVTYRGLRVSRPDQNFVELAEVLGLVDLVVVGDHYVRRGHTTPERLGERARRSGSVSALRAARLVRREVDSPMETRLRLLVVLAGLPEPRVNVKVRRPDGRVRYRFDLAWPDLRVALEYDGRHHRDDLDQWDHDLDRSDWMDDAGWLHVPVFVRGIYRRPDLTLDRVVKALRRRGCPGLPSRLDDEWRAHFPVKPAADR